MNERKIYACLDIDNRWVVKGRKFQGVEEIADPLELAGRYAAEGADALVFYDIAASIQGRDLFWDLITAIRQQIAIPFIVGGGIRTVQDAQRAFDAGADQVSVNSGALRSPELIRQIAERFGSEKVLLSMDVKRTEDGSWKVFDKAGTEDTGIDALEWADAGRQQGAGGLVVNCIDTDGMQSGYELELTDRIAKSVGIPVIASGGAGKAGHITELFERTAAQGALVASVLHYGLVSLPELQEAKSSALSIHTVKWGADGLIPAVIQDAETGDVLTLAYMNEEALSRTAATRETWLYSRSRQEQWRKGATSGNTQQVLQIDVDCDRDAVLLQVTPSGPACHTGERTCFTRQAGEDLRGRRSVLPHLYREIGLRRTSPQEGSYTAYLFREGIDKILKKVGEETAEVIIAAKNEDRTELREELADLTYHLCVLLQAMETAPEEILDVLKQRQKAGRCAP